MAFRYLIYSTGTTFSSTIVRESVTNNPGVNEASYFTDFMIPEIQPLFLWRVNNVVTPTGVIPNIDANISAYQDSIAPAPTPDDNATIGFVTGETATKIDKVSGVTGKVPIFTTDGNLQSSGYDIGQLTGGTDLTFVGSGGTQVFENGNTITIYSVVPSGTTVNWGDINGSISNQTDLWNNLTYLSGATTGLTATKLDKSVFNSYTGATQTVINNKLNTSVFNSYTGVTQPVINAAVTGVTNLGTGTTLGGVSGRNISLKSISVLGGISIVGDANNLILSGETNAAAIWGNITGTLSNQTDLWSQLTGLTAQINTKLNTSTFSTYTGTTVPNTYYNKTQINAYTGATQSLINNKLNTSVFNSYTGATDTRLDGIEDDITGLTATKLNISTFNAYTGATDTRLDGIEDDIIALSGVTGVAITGATNGLTKVGKNAELGGSLIKNTVISGTTFDFTVNAKTVNLQAINGINIIDTDGVGGINIESDAGTISLVGNTNLSVERTKLQISDTSMLITDSRTTKTGLEYAGDYGTTFTANSLVDKRYVDAIASGLVPKASVKVTTTAPVVLSGLSTVDGYALSNGDRVLVKNQGTASQNGIYVASASTWTRATDFDGQPVFGEVTSGNLIPVETGSTLHNTIWVLTTLNPITVGTTALSFSLFSKSQDLIAGTGISILANTISVNGSALAGNSITWTGDTFNVNPATGTLATALGTKLNITDFNTYSGTTVPATFLSISNFNTFTGTTLPANYYNKTQINSYSGSTLTNINSRLLTTTFNSYTGATNTRLNGIESDITYISGVTDNNFEIFTGYTASTATNQIQLIHTGGTDINTVVATGIEWHSVSHSGNSFTWTGGTDIVINKTADYEVSYHVPHGHTGTNNIRGIASNLVLNGVTILNNTVGTSGTARAGVVSSLVLPNTILSLNANDILDLVAFRTGLAGVSTTVANGVILIKEKNKLQ